jgi:DNA polymerase III epsilon subunit-like protein
VYPVGEIPAEATAIHHIDSSSYPEDHDDSLEWHVVLQKVREIITGKTVVAYNAIFDRKVIHITSERHHLPDTTHSDLSAISQWQCLMKAYKEWSRNYSYVSLEKASGTTNQSHRALGDCELARKVWLKMRVDPRPTPVPAMTSLILRRTARSYASPSGLKVIAELPHDSSLERYLSTLGDIAPQDPPQTLRELIAYYREHPEMNLEIAIPAPDTWKHVHAFLTRTSEENEGTS